MPFEWNLQGLATDAEAALGDRALDRASAFQRFSAIRPPMTGWFFDDERAADAHVQTARHEAKEATVYLHLLLMYNLGLRKYGTGNITPDNPRRVTICGLTFETHSDAQRGFIVSTRCGQLLLIFTSVCYATAVLGAIVLAFFYFGNTHLLQGHTLGWFGWCVFVLLVLCESLLVLSRVLGRASYLQFRRKTPLTFPELYGMIVERLPYATPQEGFFVVAFQLFGSGFQLFGVLLCMSQMEMHYRQPQDNGILWTVGYACFCGTLLLTALLDSVRVEQLAPKELERTRTNPYDGKSYRLRGDYAWPWALEVGAWRVALLTLVAPWLVIAYALAVNVCCEGELRFQKTIF